MKKTFLCLMMMCTLLISGCSESYERDTNPGKIETISYETIKQKIENKDKFIVILVRDGCHHCEVYEESLNTYLKEHNVTVYSMNFMNEEEPTKVWDEVKEQIFEKKTEDQAEFLGTPHTLVFEDGKMKESYSGAMTYDLGNMGDFEDLVVEYKLDELK